MPHIDSHSPGSYESSGTKIFTKIDQKVGRKDSLRIWFLYYMYTEEIRSEPFWPTFWLIFLEILVYS